MSRFLTKLRTEDIDYAGVTFRLLELLKYEVGETGEYEGVHMVVPADFITDFGSIPRFLWWLVSPHDARAPFALHDYMYSKRANCPRVIADAVLLDSMKAIGVVWWRRWSIYVAVRTFGWLYYQRR